MSKLTVRLRISPKYTLTIDASGLAVIMTLLFAAASVVAMWIFK